jgi:beta-fructofuranosidase
MNFTKTTLRSIFLIFLLSPLCSQAENMSEAILRATAAVQAAAPRAQADPARPIFHITSPAQWMNDPNGPIFYQGHYHLFYQLTPDSDESGIKFWGHVRSRNLVKWEPLPIALAPSNDEGEDSIWSGCCTINGLGQPMVFYTSIGAGKSAFDQAAQWAAIGDKHLIAWKKSPANPVLSDETNDGTKIYDWRDPFIFRDGKKTFLIAGGHLKKDGDAAVNIYEAQNSELTRWQYRGVLFEIPDAPTVECPNFFKLGDQWVLFFSPYGRVQFFTGDFDAATCRFHPRTHGLLDYGSNFYAPNTMQVPDGRRLVWGWVNGFPGGHGWNGCLSLPRQLSFSRGGELLQNPAPQLSRLRGGKIEWQNIRLENGGETLTLPKTNALEIAAEIDLPTAKNIALEFKSGEKNTPPIVVSFGESELKVADATAPLPLAQNGKTLKLRIFFDRSVLEVFANETVCCTKRIVPLDCNATLEIRADGGGANMKRIQAWPMKSIW